MKLKTMMLISLVLLAILTIGSASAEESLTIENDTLNAPTDDIDVLSDDEKQDFDYNAEMPDEVYEYNTYDEYETQIRLNIPWEHDGNISVLIDDEEKYNEETSQYYDSTYQINLLPLLDGLSYDKHNIVLNYCGDTQFKNYTYSKTVNYDFIKFIVPETVTVAHSNEFRAIVPETVDGTLTLYINSKVYDTQEFYEGRTSIYYDTESYSKTSYKLEFKDNTGKYPKRSVSGSFTPTFYFDVYPSDAYECYVGENATFEINLPGDANGNVEITYNGNKKSEKITEGWARATIDDLKLGKNNLTFKFTYDKHTRTLIRYADVRPIVRLDSDVRYNSDDGFYLRIPGDAKGEVKVYVDGNKIPATLKDGEMKVVLSGFDAKNTHELVFNYTGDDYEIEGSGEAKSFKIVPDIRIPKDVFIKEDVDISILMPEDGNGTFAVSVGGKEISSTDVINGTAKITVPKDTFRCDENWVTFDYDGNYHSPDINEEYVTGHDHPGNITLEINCPDTFVKGNTNFLYHNLPYDAYGTLSIFINNKNVHNYTISNREWYESIIDANNLIQDLDYGTYNFTFKYSGNQYYRESSQSKLLGVSYYRLDFESPIVIGDNNGFYIEVAREAPTTAEIYIGGKLYQKGEVIEHDGETYWIGIHFDLSELPCGEYSDAKLVYKGNSKYPGFTKYLKFNVTYAAVIENYDQTYEGEYAEFNVTFAVDLTGNASIIIDDKVYTSKIINRTATFRVLSFVGNKDVTINYEGDGTYPATSRVQGVSITPQIRAPRGIYIKDTGKVSLILPKDAKGNLTVKLIKRTEDDSEIIQNESMTLVNGEAEIALVKLNLGQYYIEAAYTGEDYAVENLYDSYGVRPNITCKSIYVGEDFNFIFEMPEDAGGILKISLFGNEEYERELADGKATLTLKNLHSGDYYFTYSYTGGKYGSVESEEGVELYFTVNRLQPGFTHTVSKEIIANNPFKITVKGPKDVTGWIEVFMDGEYDTTTFKNGVATVSMKSTKSGKVTVTYNYDGDDKYDSDWGEFTINVLMPTKVTAKDQSVFYSDGSAFKVTAYDSFGKAVGAGEAVTFYIDGKKVNTIKTDKNGVAALKITKLPKTYKVKATYKGASVTKKLTVKHVVTLKTATVKKSAKKLVLTATLKNKKAIQGKIVTFKFNGKTYKAKTNKKGIAKVTVKKSVLKKLKVGKKVTYSATYLKDTVKKTAKVRR